VRELEEDLGIPRTIVSRILTEDTYIRKNSLFRRTIFLFYPYAFIRHTF
jgi:hypothetical protein